MQGLQNNPELMRQMLQGQTGQLLQNPQMMMEMMQNPAVQQTMDMLMENPQVLEQMMSANPMFAGNPEMVCFSGKLPSLVTYCCLLLV